MKPGERCTRYASDRHDDHEYLDFIERDHWGPLGNHGRCEYVEPTGQSRMSTRQPSEALASRK